MEDQNLQQNITAAAESLAQSALAALRAESSKSGELGQSLYDLRLATARKAAEMLEAEVPEASISDDAILDFAEAMPAYDTVGFYNVRNSLISVGVAVLLGWILGGIASTLLGLVGLGGEILRPAAIFGLLWLEDFLSANPKARKVILAVLGMGALTRYVAALASGVVRFASLGSIRGLIFGSLSRVSIFKAAWLWFGALLMLVFFAKKRTGLDAAKAEHSLIAQISQRILLGLYAFRQISASRRELQELRLALEEKGGSGKCPNRDCGLAAAAMSMLGSLGPEQARHLRDALAEAGFEIRDSDQEWLIWNEKEHAPYYNALGLIRNGDKCLVLAHPWKSGDELIKGTVQRAPGQRI